MSQWTWRAEATRIEPRYGRRWWSPWKRMLLGYTSVFDAVIQCDGAVMARETFEDDEADRDAARIWLRTQLARFGALEGPRVENPTEHEPGLKAWIKSQLEKDPA